MSFWQTKKQAASGDTLERYLSSTADPAAPPSSSASPLPPNTTSNVFWGKVVCTIDASAESVLAIVNHLYSYAKIKQHVKKHGSDARRRYVHIPSTRSALLSVEIRFPIVKQRLFNQWVCWTGTLIDGKQCYVQATGPAEDFNPDKKYFEETLQLPFTLLNTVPAKAEGVFIVKKLAKDVCEFTWASRVNMGGALPAMVMNYAVIGEMEWVRIMQHEHERKSEDVDRELRELRETGSVPKMEALAEEARGVLERCLALMQEPSSATDSPSAPLPRTISNTIPSPASSSVSSRRTISTAYAVVPGWTPLKSPSPLVQMSSRIRIAHHRDDRSVALGKAVCVVDTTATDIASWLIAFCSRCRMQVRREEQETSPKRRRFRPPCPPLVSTWCVAHVVCAPSLTLPPLQRSKEDNDSARLVVRENSPNDVVVATVKAMPFPLHKSEFVARIIAATVDSGLYVATESVPEALPYLNFNAIRAQTRAILQIHALHPPDHPLQQCKVTLVQYMDAGGRIPLWLVNRKLPDSLALLDVLREAFQRDEEVDDIARADIAKTMTDEATPYTPEELQVIAEVRRGVSTSFPFKSLESPDFRVKLGMADMQGTSFALGRSSTVIDVDIATCAAWEFDKLSRLDWKVHIKFGGVERNSYRVNGHNSVYQVVYDFKMPGLQPREWTSRIIFKWADEEHNKLEVFYSPAVLPEFPLRKHIVRASSLVHAIYEKLEPVEGIAQTSVQYNFQANLGGLISASMVNSQGVDTLMIVGEMRKKFDRSHHVDSVRILRAVQEITEHAAVYSGDEERIIATGLAHLNAFERHKYRKVISSPSPVMTSETALIASEAGILWGRSKTTVRATKEEILAYLLEIDLRCRWKPSDLERTVLEVVNGHHRIICQCKNANHVGAGYEFARREGVSSVVWKR